MLDSGARDAGGMDSTPGGETGVELEANCSQLFVGSPEGVWDEQQRTLKFSYFKGLKLVSAKLKYEIREDLRGENDAVAEFTRDLTVSDGFLVFEVPGGQPPNLGNNSRITPLDIWVEGGGGKRVKYDVGTSGPLYFRDDPQMGDRFSCEVATLVPEE